ncbi:alcohol dehydrogenase catalytic domain-containing protein [Rhodobacteraceae bacterium NNCM2]|nr:alcohol dehydrogenase catalytic domain-containing protein [Coraliihabitans acroporae]
MSLPDKMHALTVNQDGFAEGAGIGPYLEAFDPYLTLSELPVPEPGPGQVLVRVRAAAINPSDIHFIKGEYGLPRVAGAIAGFEGCGDVVAVGEGAEGLNGQRIAFIGSKTGTGSWAEFVLAEATSCVPLPEAIRDEDAAGLFVNPLTAVAMISLVAEAGSPAVVLSAGASQLSQLMIGLARDRGIRTIPLVRRAEQKEMLSTLGADCPVDISEPGFSDTIAQILRAEKPRVFLDAVVDARSAEVFFAMPRQSRWVIYGLLDSAPVTLDQMGQLIFAGKRIEGFWLTNWFAGIDKGVRESAFQTVFSKFGTGEWKTIVRKKLSLIDAPGRLSADIKSQNIGKLIFVP